MTLHLDAAPSATDRTGILRARVIRTVESSTHYRTVVLGGPPLRAFRALGRDQAFRLFFPRPDQGRLTLPDPGPARWLPAHRALPEDCRPFVRTFTVRRFDAGAGELEVEFATHDGGAASAWAQRCRAGDEAGVRAEGVRYAPSRPGRQLLMGDDTGLPALLGILERAGDDLEADVLIEVPSRRDVRPLPGLPAGVRLQWLPRESARRPGDLLLRTVRGLQPRPLAYAYALGECDTVTQIRRHLLTRWSVPADDICIVGYWTAV